MRAADSTPLLVTGGTAHDFAYARARLQALLGEIGDRPAREAADYGAALDLTPATPLVTYTCRLSPSEAERAALAAFLAAGGRWFALHGTNAVLDGCHLPDLLGSRFRSHPPYGPFSVTVAAPDDPLVAAVEPFAVEDECYEIDLADGLAPLLLGQHGDAAPRTLMYRRSIGSGAIVYLALGHCDDGAGTGPPRRGPWQTEPFRAIVRRGLRWACRL